LASQFRRVPGTPFKLHTKLKELCTVQDAKAAAFLVHSYELAQTTLVRFAHGRVLLEDAGVFDGHLDHFRPDREPRTFVLVDHHLSEYGCAHPDASQLTVLRALARNSVAVSPQQLYAQITAADVAALHAELWAEQGRVRLLAALKTTPRGPRNRLAGLRIVLAGELVTDEHAKRADWLKKAGARLLPPTPEAFAQAQAVVETAWGDSRPLARVVPTFLLEDVVPLEPMTAPNRIGRMQQVFFAGTGA
jgi:hypothetical protein